MAKKCTPKDPIVKDASVEATKTALAIQASYTREFGMPMNELPMLQGELKALNNDLGLAKLKLKTAIGKKQNNNILKYKKEVNKKNKEIKDKRIAIKEAPDKFKRLTRIRNMLTEVINYWADKQAFDMNPDIYFPIIKDFLLERYGFLPNMSTSIGGLNAIEKRLGKIFEQQKENVRKDEPIPILKRQMQDPGILILKQDPTGLAYDLVNKSRQAPAEIFGIVNKYNTRVKQAATDMNDWLTDNNFLFQVNVPSHGQVDHDSLVKSFDNVVKFAFDAMDGRAKYVVPMPIGEGNKEFKADEAAYNKIVRRNILQKINEGGQIQKFTTPQGQNFYYVTIKQDIDSHDGKEVYYAYQVPHKPGKEKEGVAVRDFLLLPRSSKKGIKGDLSRKDYDTALGEDVRLATYTNKAGQVVQGRMNEGWYEAKTYKPLEARKKVVVGGQVIERKDTVHSYSNYVYNDNLNPTDHPQSKRDLPPAFWDFIRDLRATLKDFHTYATDKNRTTEQVRNGIVGSLNKLGAKKMAMDEFDELMSQALSIDGLRSNMRVDSKGTLVTANTFFGEQYNYVPWRYTVSDLITGNIKARDALIAKIDDLTKAIKYGSYQSSEGLTPAEALDKGAEIASNKLDVELLEGLISHFDDLIDGAAGLKTLHDSERLNQVQTVTAAQHRKGFLNPLPTKDEEGNIVNYGRLANMEIFPDYFYDNARTLVHNDLRNDLFNVLGNTEVATSEFMIDHVKATFGMLDIDAGVFGFDYSNPRVAELITKAFKKRMGPDYEVTPENIHTVARMHSMFISGNLLQLGSSLNNNFQRISVWIESVNQDWETVDRLMDDKIVNPNSGRPYADEIAEASGVTEVSVGLADSLLGAMSDDVTMGTGWFAKQDFVVLSLGKREALEKMRKSKVWISFFEALIERRQGGTKATTIQLRNMYEGTWETINGINKGTLTKEQLEGIKENFEGILSAEFVNQYASWGLKGGYASGGLKRIGADKLLTFSGAEEAMRRWTAVHGAVLAKKLGMIPHEVMEDPKKFGYNSMYLHPNALKMARILNNVTMFGLSPQFLPQMFRGATGTLLFKFKPYQWHQGRREAFTALNLWDSLSGMKKREWLKQFLLLGIPPLFGEKPIPGMGYQGRKLLSEPHEKMRRFVWSRVLISLLFTPSIMLPGITALQRGIRKQFRSSAYGAGQRAMERGGESVIMSSVMHLISLIAIGVGYTDDDEEEDDVYRESARWFLPFYVNLAIETARGKPENALRAYSQSFYRALGLGKKGLQWAGIMDEDAPD
jgi:hypothetical protein